MLRDASPRIFIHLVCFLAATGTAYYYYYYFCYREAQNIIMFKGVEALVATAIFVGPAQFLVALIFKMRNEMIAAGPPSFIEMAVTVPVVFFSPYDLFVVPIPFGIALLLFGHNLALIKLLALIDFILSFVVIRAARVAYTSFMKQIGCVAAYLWMLYIGQALFIGFPCCL